MTHPYASKKYAECFGEGFEPVELKQAKSFVLKRKIPGTDYYDAMGIYPLCPIVENAEISADFAALKKEGVISLVLVTDSFAHPPADKLKKYFDTVKEYKEHFLHDFSGDGKYSKHHRYEVKKAIKSCEMKIIGLDDYLDDWCDMYGALVKKHGIAGIQNFSKNYFAGLARLEPLMVGAFNEGIQVSAHIWIVDKNHSYSHLAASSEEGYKLSAAYGIYDFSLQHMKESGVKIVDLGGGAGVSDASKGLAFLKKGFSNSTINCYLCTKILDQDIYDKLSAGKKTEYFPAYRS